MSDERQFSGAQHPNEIDIDEAMRYWTGCFGFSEQAFAAGDRRRDLAAEAAALHLGKL